MRLSGLIALMAAATLGLTGCTQSEPGPEQSGSQRAATSGESTNGETEAPATVGLTVCVGVQDGMTADSIRLTASASGRVLLDQEVSPGTTLTIPGFPLGSDIDVALDGETKISGTAREITSDFTYSLGTGC